ncbi:MAG: hypothetical protein COV75_07170 [Candidatus Omnitrophica bacterium CG11_big_fil_rev_8_21_14_0_20_63_9]|nr:MAG: hypothetical protein COV75_07170 [Candidatus Omnitrophica bacterium CG11_big_fil_rev_8_21_14_0_20_63_9]
MSLRRASGQTLLVVLWVMGLLTIAAGALTMRSAHELRLGRIPASALARKAIAQAGVHQAVAVLSADDTDGQLIDHMGETWSTGIDEATGTEMFRDIAVGSGTFSIGPPGLVDEERKLPLNLATPEQLRALIDAVQPGGVDAEAVVSAIVDWRDEPDGAVCASMQPACHNGPLDRVEELRAIPGVPPALMTALQPYVTVYGSGRVNVNTAPAIVLDAMGCPGSDLVAQRELEPFAAPPAECPSGVVASSAFTASVVVSGQLGDGTAPLVAVLDRAGCVSEDPHDPCILAWLPQ